MAFIPALGFLHSIEVERAVTPIGEQVVAAAQEGAPYLTGHLSESIDGEWTTVDGKRVYRVFAKDFKAPWFEFGTINMEARPFLGPAAMQIVGNLH